MTDDTGWLVWASDYEPYGLPRSTWQKYAGLDSLIRHRFTDQEFDAETRLYNYNARLYDPTIARFILPDTIVQSPYSSIGLNRYMYVAGNPLRYTDPTGHLKIGKFLSRATHTHINSNQVLGAVEFAAGVYLAAHGNVNGAALMSDGWDRMGDGGVGSKKGGKISFNASIPLGPNSQSTPNNGNYQGTQQGSSSGQGNKDYYPGIDDQGSYETYIFMLKYGLLNERLESLHFEYGTPLYAFEDIATTWANIGRGGGMNYVAMESDKLDIDSRIAVKALLVTGGAVGAAALAPEAYLLFLTHPAAQSRIADFVSGYAPGGTPPLNWNGVRGYLFGVGEDYVRKQ